jgi:hypothetical protein
MMRKLELIDIWTALPEKPNGFLDQFRVFIRSRGLAYATEKTYLLWFLGGLHRKEVFGVRVTLSESLLIG